MSTENVCVYVAGLSFNVNENHLKEIFSNSGKVIETKIAKNKFNQSLGWGLVTFGDLEDASEPIAFMNGGQIDGCIISVREYNPDTDKI